MLKVQFLARAQRALSTRCGRWAGLCTHPSEQWGHMKIASFFTALAIATCSMAHAAEPMWHWVWVVPATDPQKGWSVFEGDAQGQFDGTNLDINLSAQSGDWSPELHVQGRVTGREVRATVTRVGTDAAPEQYAGNYAAVRSTPSDAAQGWGEDRIALQNGVTFLGLSRNVRSVH